VDHGPEFVDRERLTITADARLRVERRAARRQLDDQGSQQDRRPGDDQQHQGGEGLPRALQRAIPMKVQGLDICGRGVHFAAPAAPALQILGEILSMHGERGSVKIQAD
jgi:hypothetical protein